MSSRGKVIGRPSRHYECKKLGMGRRGLLRCFHSYCAVLLGLDVKGMLVKFFLSVAGMEI